MRWPLRNQILVPFLSIQVITVVAVAATSAWNAVRQVDRDLKQRLDGVVATLESASYPLTTRVLSQLHDLSGAEFIVMDADDSLVIATLSSVESDELSAVPVIRGDDEAAVSNRSVIDVGGTAYISGFARRRTGPSGSWVLVLYPERRWALARWEAMFPPLLMGAALMCLTLAVSVWVSRRIARRIQRVQQHVSRIAGGDFTPVPQMAFNDELRDLSDGVNQMAGLVDQSMRRVRESERSTLLNQLVGGLAHQLRNSLTGARTSIQLHRRHCDLENDEAIEVALRQLTLTEEQIKALLRLSKGESPAPTRERLAAIVDDVTSLVRPLAQHKKVDFVYDRTETDSEVCDADAMRGALLNLMINAMEATDTGGEVRVVVEYDADSVTIDIVDNGPGIPASIREKVFVPFFTTKPEGAGLGLALARQAVEDCGGTLEPVDAERGTRFRVRIPSHVPGIRDDREACALRPAKSGVPTMSEVAR
ncbi:MAG: sensor histidine kinase [Planctomycetota bacterium]|nr:MAG: sensor histidine kinase [Planctomycetota bacterium]REK35370.1 MAG: sensor histidine kinase [Planctomycetota bacterium]